MKLPTRIAVTLTSALTGLMALSAEVHMSHPAHVACLIAGGLLLGLFVHPGEAGTIPATGGIPTPTDGSNQTPAPPL
jgi:hypothetical protein